MSDRNQPVKNIILKWLADYPSIFSWSEVKEGIHLIEINTRKERTLMYPEITDWRRKENAEGLGDYLNLLFEDGHELVLCDAGFAFSPSYLSAPPMGGRLPAVVCLSDFYRLRGHLEHLYKDPTQKIETLRTLMDCLAILEGAKLVELDVSEEEQNLDVILNFLEKT